MLSIASVAQGEQGENQGEFTANLEPLLGAGHDSGTMMWWRMHPRAWRQATKEQKSPALVMRGWSDWVRNRPGTPVFVSHPLTFDGAWVDWYLQRFAGCRLFDRPRKPGLCCGGGIDLPSLIMAMTGWDYRRCNRGHYFPAWLGGNEHNHCALDDARGYAHLFSLVMSRRILEYTRN